jgi:hypothetical protein
MWSTYKYIYIYVYYVSDEEEGHEVRILGTGGAEARVLAAGYAIQTPHNKQR